MKILLGSCTKHNVAGFEKSPLYTSLLKGFTSEYTKTAALYTGEIDAAVRIQNTKSICEHYNKVLKIGVDGAYDCVILMHDDVSIEDRFLDIKIEEAFHEHDIVGAAGAKQVKIAEPALWHIMSKQEDWSGAVAHRANEKQVFMTNFGPTPARCLVLDGLFLAIKVSSITDDIKFDEKFRFHHYDIDFCLNANKHGLKLTTWPIWMVHDSSGLDERGQEFNYSERRFLNKWKKN